MENNGEKGKWDKTKRKYIRQNGSKKRQDRFG